MKITWLGHASFLLESHEGTRVVTDPFEAGSYDGAVGYRIFRPLLPMRCLGLSRVWRKRWASFRRGRGLQWFWFGATVIRSEKLPI